MACESIGHDTSSNHSAHYRQLEILINIMIITFITASALITRVLGFPRDHF